MHISKLPQNQLPSAQHIPPKHFGFLRSSLDYTEVIKALSAQGGKDVTELKEAGFKFLGNYSVADSALKQGLQEQIKQYGVREGNAIIKTATAYNMYGVAVQGSRGIWVLDLGQEARPGVILEEMKGKGLVARKVRAEDFIIKSEEPIATVLAP